MTWSSPRQDRDDLLTLQTWRDNTQPELRCGKAPYGEGLRAIHITAAARGGRIGTRSLLQGFRIYGSDEERVARQAQADVDRALEVLGAEADAAEARICGSVQDLRRRLDALLDDLLPPAFLPGLGERVLRWMGLGTRARAADAALATLLRGGCPPGTRHIAICFGGSVHAFRGRVPPEQAMREHVGDVLDDAYCVLLPHEAARRAELHRAFWAEALKKGRNGLSPPAV